MCTQFQEWNTFSGSCLFPGPVIGGIIGALLVVAIVAGVFIYCKFFRKKTYPDGREGLHETDSAAFAYHDVSAVQLLLMRGGAYGMLLAAGTVRQLANRQKMVRTACMFHRHPSTKIIIQRKHYVLQILYITQFWRNPIFSKGRKWFYAHTNLWLPLYAEFMVTLKRLSKQTPNFRLLLKLCGMQ